MNDRPKIWVTQTRPRAEHSAKDFAALGLDVVVLPVLTVEPVIPAPKPPDPKTLLIFTSRNGVRAYAAREDNRANPVICVGDATAELAKAVGFKDVQSAGGDARDVVKRVRQTVPLSRAIRHCSGKYVKGEIVETLADFGYSIARVQYYVTSPIAPHESDLSALTYVALYSPRGAASFVDWVKGRDTSHLQTLSISQATDSVLEPLNLRRRLIADTPDQSAMLAVLRSHL